jgi:hypothetical protein
MVRFQLTIGGQVTKLLNVLRAYKYSKGLGTIAPSPFD